MMKERTRSEKSAACPSCGKTFARSDTLLRHQRSHNATEERGELHRVTSGTFRACTQCAVARSRCSGGAPCGRCTLRKLECLYPEKKRKTGHPPVQDLQLHGVTADHLSTQYSDYDMSDGHKSPGLNPKSPSNIEPPPSTVREPFVSMSTQAPAFRQFPENLSNTILPDQAIMPANMPVQYGTALDPAPMSLDFQSFDDSINWIPVSVFPSPYDAELEQDFSFLLPPFDTNINLDAGYSMHQNVENAFEIPQHNSTNGHPAENANAVNSALLAFSPTSSGSNGHTTTKSVTSSTDALDNKRKRRKSSFVPDAFEKPRLPSMVFAFPRTSETGEDAVPETMHCSEACYNDMTVAFNRLCLSKDHLHPFESSQFPSYEEINAFMSLYFDHFHSGLPLIHRPTFGATTEWILVLAVAAIGSSFGKSTQAIDAHEPCLEFLRRAVQQRMDLQPTGTTNIAFTQARILNLVGLTMSHREQLRSMAPRYHADLSRWCLESGILQLLSDDASKMNTAHTKGHQQVWMQWIEVESARRAGYIAWLLDTSLAYLANSRPLCNMDDARTSLPCTETIWEATSAEEWIFKTDGMAVTPSLCAALEELYADKAVDSQLSDLSQTLLINALYQRTWEVGTHIKQPLSEWVPTGKARGFLNTPSKDSFWLPLYPLYANWRNSACDCLDLVQWHAASVVAKSSGVEHSLMLHLHLARIILLTPFQEIQDLVLSLIGRIDDNARASFYVHDGSYQPRNKAKLPQIRKIIWRWLKEDQHKARLAMVHAGSVFWHVRRYSSQSLYEPLAVYLASLVLWTYGSYKSAALERENQKEGGPSGPDADMSVVQPSHAERHVKELYLETPDGTTPVANAQQEDDDAESDSSSQDQPEFVHLDRPNDEEMVAHFVRNGHHMSAHMSNVGDICKSPQKVLSEGAKLLRTRLGCWGVSREYYDMLTKLSELRKAP